MRKFWETIAWKAELFRKCVRYEVRSYTLRRRLAAARRRNAPAGKR